MVDRDPPRARPIAVELRHGPPPFVGRAAEIEEITGELSAARDGAPRLLLVTGEAGVGKSRLVREAIERLPPGHRAAVHTGRCFEDLSVPRLPFIEGLLPAIELLHGREHLTEADAEVIARLASGGGAPGGQSPIEDEDDAELLAIRRAVGRGIRELAAGGPFVFVVEDLHWADAATLALLSHVVFTLGDGGPGGAVPVAIVATSRPVPDGHPLSGVVARLRREPICRTIELKGLDSLAVGELVRGMGVERASRQLTRRVEGVTRGNPLFVQHAVSQLVELGALAEQGGHVVAEDAPESLPIPPELSEGIAQRLGRLDSERQRLLGAAAVGGDRIDLALLAEAAEVEQPVLLEALEEASLGGFMLSDGQGFAFAHPLVREVALARMSAERRQRLHARFAGLLEGRHVDDLESLAPEIARHVIRAGPHAERAELARWTRLAGERTAALSGWGDSAEFFVAGIEATRQLSGPHSRELAEMHDGAARGFYRNHDPGPCSRHAGAVVEICDAQERPLDDEWLRLKARNLVRGSRADIQHRVSFGEATDVESLASFADELRGSRPAMRSQMLAQQSQALARSGRSAEAEAVAAEALDLAKQTGDDGLSAGVLQSLGLAKMQNLDDRGALDCFERALGLAERSGDASRSVRVGARSLQALLTAGRLVEAGRRATHVFDQAREVGEWSDQSFAAVTQAAVATATGDFGEAERSASRAIPLIARSDYLTSHELLYPCLASARYLQGNWDDARDALDLWMGPEEISVAWAFRRLIAARSGDIEGARAEVDGNERRAFWPGRLSADALATLASLVELGDLLERPRMAEHPDEVLGEAGSRGTVFTILWSSFLPRVRGVAAAVQGSFDEAEQRLDGAIALAGEIGARPELGRAHLDYARMLWRRDGRRGQRRIEEHLEPALRIFSELGMEPFIDQAADLAGELGRAAPPARERYPGGITEREVQVLRELTGGLSNDEIAEKLVISPATARRHVANIFQKLDVRNRAAAAAFCVTHGLDSEPST